MLYRVDCKDYQDSGSDSNKDCEASSNDEGAESSDSES